LNFLFIPGIKPSSSLCMVFLMFFASICGVSLCLCSSGIWIYGFSLPLPLLLGRPPARLQWIGIITPIATSRTRTELMTNQSTPVTGTIKLCISFVPCPQFFCLLKPIAHVCTLKMADDELSAYFAFSHSMSWAVW
jgi:hypothetical protein